MVMVLTLLVYSIAEWMLRKKLKEAGETVPNQKKKPTQRPTMAWIFFLFRAVTEVVVEIGDNVHRKVSRMSDTLWRILKLLGPECQKYYEGEA